MRVVCEAIKEGRSWSESGIQASIQFMVALRDGLDINTLIGTQTKEIDELAEDKSPKYYKEKLKASAGEAIRHNVSYLHQSTGKLVYQDLKGLHGY